MNLINGNLTIRNALPADAEQLCKWWNDGKIMAHAGFPNGLGEKPETIRESLAKDSDETHRRHVIEQNNSPIGEMNYRNKGSNIAQIGIKICDSTYHEQGIGTTLLTIFMDALFTYYGYEKIILDANLKNPRAQHVYEKKLGFTKLRLNENSWQDQLGEMQSSIDYEMTKESWQALRLQKPITYLHLRPERPADYYTVESLTREAFWDNEQKEVHHICDEHLLVRRLRENPSYVPELNYVAEQNGKIVGHIIYAKSKITNNAGDSHEVLTFGPLSVLPEHQKKGIGKALMHITLRIAKNLGYHAVLIYGHTEYYPRIGFRPAAEFVITKHDGTSADYIMAYPLYEGALNNIQGRLHLDPVYETLTQEDALEFDKQFPPK